MNFLMFNVKTSCLNLYVSNFSSNKPTPYKKPFLRFSARFFTHVVTSSFFPVDLRVVSEPIEPERYTTRPNKPGDIQRNPLKRVPCSYYPT